MQEQQIVDKLKNYQPEKIILFGSYAWGQPTPDSDVDLLVIKNTQQDHYQRIPEVRRHLYDIDEAFDILVMTPQEIENRLQIGDCFIKEIIDKGKILMERKIIPT